MAILRQRWVLKINLMVLVILGMGVNFLAGCSRVPAAGPSPASPSAAGETISAGKASTEILTGVIQPVTFEQVTQAVEALYSHHPEIVEFSERSVSFTAETRDKVLQICSQGSALSATQSEREKEKVMACAPLIFFYYEFGRQKLVPEAIEVAQKIYWYTATNNPGLGQPPEGLNSLLQGWGIK